MWVWIFMLLSIVAFWVMIPDALGKKKKNLIFLVLSFAVIVFVMGSRSPHLMYGADLRNYYRMFTRSYTMGFEQYLQRYEIIETGYLILNKIVSVISPLPYTFQYVEAAFCTGIMFWYIYRNADSVFIAVITYICFGSWQFFLTGFKQAFAVCICIIALECMKKNKTSWDVLAAGLILLATTIHVTAWVFVLTFIIRRIRITKMVMVYAACITLILLVFIDDIVAFGNSIVKKNYTLKYYGNTFGGLVPIAVYLGALLLTYLVWTRDKSYIDKVGFEVAILIFGLCFYVLRYSASIMERVSVFFTPVVSVIFTNGIMRQRDKSTLTRILPILWAVFCIILFVYRSQSQLGNYRFFWEYLERLIYV
ncbi:MAG: EpsG family protein [Ruminococcus sp.]|nr:EpsG family protein [Ruminococcus sp.]